MKIKSKEEAARMLAELGRLQAQVEAAEAKAKEKTQPITEDLERTTAPLKGEAARLQTALESWARDNLPPGKRSIRLITGVLKFAAGPPRLVEVLKLETIISKIKGAANLDHCLKTDVKLNKPALAQLDDGLLSRLGLRRESGKETFRAVPEGDYGQQQAA